MYLITGGCGFVGSNIAERLIKRGDEVAVFDNLSRHGATANLAWLRGLGLKHFIHGDIRNQGEVDDLVAELKPHVIFHLSGQVAMTTSVKYPRRDFEINVLGSINILESARRHCPGAAIVYSSSNKVYGELHGIELVEEDKRYSALNFPRGIDELMPLDFRTPYGCSKGAADQYMLNYARDYGLRTVVFRHSTIYGGRQYATFDQGWVGWFCQQAFLQKKAPRTEAFTISGDGKQVRDLLFVDDAVDCYLAAVKHLDRAQGEAFNIGGGIDNSCSILELFDELAGILHVEPRYRRIAWRKDDQKYFVADIGKAKKLLDWSPLTNKKKGIASMCGWVEGLDL